MSATLPQLLLVAGLVVINAILAGSEIALISLREAQLAKLERRGGAGRVVARLARDPNRFLATIQIGITLSGFLASATAAVTLAEPVVPYLSFMGGAADTAAIVAVTLILSYFTLVLGELAPKRLALQRAESWALMIGRPLTLLAVITKPLVWLLSISTDVVVRLFGGRPGATREEVDLEELRDMVIANRGLREDHQEVLLGAFEVAERSIGDVMTPRTDVFSLEEGTTAAVALQLLIQAGHTRAPVAGRVGGLDSAKGVVGLVDLLTADPGSPVEKHAKEPPVFPDSVLVLVALRSLQQRRQHLALVVDEFGGIDGIITVEDLIEELVGEIYDETDRDVLGARKGLDGTVLVPGRFPIHDLVDLGIEAPEGDYRTVAGLIIERLGRIAVQGDALDIPGWRLGVENVEDRSITLVKFTPTVDATVANGTGDTTADTD
ncbi:MAG: hemolysin family protein [Acidimicrobiia bacterium]